MSAAVYSLIAPAARAIAGHIHSTTAYTLRPNTLPNAQPLDIFNVSLSGDVFLREVI